MKGDNKKAKTKQKNLQRLNMALSRFDYVLFLCHSVSFLFILFFNKFLTAPYDNYRPTKESTVRAFWVQASPEGQTHKLGVPMIMNISTHQDQFLTQDLLNELVCIGN